MRRQSFTSTVNINPAVLLREVALFRVSSAGPRMTVSLRFVARIVAANGRAMRHAMLVSGMSLSGCAGIVVEHPIAETLSAESFPLSAIYQEKLSDPACHLEGTAENGVMTYQCRRRRTEWMFIVIAAGVAIPIPYYRYRHWDSVLVQDGKVMDVKGHVVGATGALCGVVMSADVPVLGCKYANASRVNTWELGQ